MSKQKFAVTESELYHACLKSCLGLCHCVLVLEWSWRDKRTWVFDLKCKL